MSLKYKLQNKIVKKKEKKFGHGIVGQGYKIKIINTENKLYSFFEVSLYVIFVIKYNDTAYKIHVNANREYTFLLNIINIIEFKIVCKIPYSKKISL